MKAGISLLMSIILLFPILFISPLDTSASLSRNELEVGAGKEYATINGALTDAMEGDTILVHPGTYYEHLILEKGVRIKGFDDQTTIIDGSGVNSTIIVHSDHVMIESLTLMNSGSNVSGLSYKGYDASIYVNASYLNVIDCTFRNNIMVPIFIGLKGDYSMISGCSFYGYSMNHIRISAFNVGHFSIMDNIFRNSGCHIYLYRASSIDSLYIVGNEFMDEGPEPSNSSAINFAYPVGYDAVRNCVVANNIFRGTEIGVDLRSGVDIEIIYNSFINCTREGVRVENSTGVKIHHNNFIDCNDGDIQGSNRHYDADWDDEVSQGNYWNDYEHQNPLATNDSTIWDTPYMISGDSKAYDDFPLVESVTETWTDVFGPWYETSKYPKLVRQGGPFGIYLDIFDFDTPRNELFMVKVSGPGWLKCAPGGLLWGTVPEDEALAEFPGEVLISDEEHSVNVTFSLEVTIKKALVAHWTFTNNTTRMVIDSSEFGNDGIMKNNARWFPALKGSGMMFTGNEDSVEFPQNQSLNISGEYSILLSVFPTPEDQSTLTLIEKGNMFDGKQWRIFLRMDDGCKVTILRDDPEGCYIYYRASKIIPMNEWTYIGYTYDGSHLSTYINGERLSKFCIDMHMPTSNDPLFLGGNYNSVIDEIMIYNYPITSADVEDIYEGLRKDMETYEYPDHVPEYTDWDEDQLIDQWEIEQFGDLERDGSSDSDGDGFTNYEEYSMDSDPNEINDPDIVDRDFDDLRDQWERDHFGTTLYSESQDFDRDGYSNLEEQLIGSDPTDMNDPDPMLDTDIDGLLDSWELEYFGGLDQEPSDDFDVDGYDNHYEFIMGKDPANNSDPPQDIDMDSDDLPDIWELENFGNLSYSKHSDPDLDGVKNKDEYQYGSDPNDIDDPTEDVDLDGDGLPDRWEYEHFGDLSQNSLDDHDGDGSMEIEEYQGGTDPTDADDRPCPPKDPIPSTLTYLMIIFISIFFLIGIVATPLLLTFYYCKYSKEQYESE